MLRVQLTVLVLSLLTTLAAAQTKIGGNPVYINADAYLELGDSVGADKGLLMPRVALKSIVSPAPMQAHVAGMAVYNTASAGVPPNDVNPGVYYNDGSRWQKLNSGASGGFIQVRDSNVLYITPRQLTVALSKILRNSDTATMLANYFNAAFNGLMKQGQAIGLGGTLTQPTTIHASHTNTLAVTGLARGSGSDSIVVSENGTGILKKVAPGNFSNNVVKMVYSAFKGQTAFTVFQPVTDVNKISLYRNGIKLDVTQVGINVIQLEPGVSCDANDEIRIVQIY